MSEKEKQEKTLRIFELCKELTTLLGEKEAIADLKILQNLHPEMFKDMEEVSQIIKEVVSKPEIIINNPTPKSDKDFIAARKLNEEKMGEVGVRRDENINKIFHANEKNAKKIKQLWNKKGIVYKQSMVGTPTSYTQAQSLDERLVQKNISSTAYNNIIPQTQSQSQKYSKQNNINNSKQEKINALREQVNNIVKNRTTNSSKYLSLKVYRKK